MKNVPNLRFKEFSDEWNQVVLGDFLIKSSAITTENSDIPVATSSRKGLFLQTEYFNKEIAAKDTTGYNIVKKGYFTYRHMSDDSKFFFNINNKWDEILVSPEYPVFTTNQNLDSYFLQLHLNDSKSFSKFCKIQKKGGTRTRLYYSVLEGYKLLLPNIHEQEKISSFFSLIDKKIELQTEKVEELKNYKKGIMQKIFSQELRFKDENGNEYPEWEEKKLEECVDIFLGLTYTPTYVPKGIPFLSVKDISNNSEICFDNIKYISEEEYKIATSNAKPQKGDILFGRVGTLGNPIIITEEIDICIFVSLGFLRVKGDNISNLFISQWMKSELFLKQVEMKIAGSSQKNLNTGWLKSFNIDIPSINEQNKICRLLNNIDLKIKREQEKLDNLNEYKKGLLQQMFI